LVGVGVGCATLGRVAGMLVSVPSPRVAVRPGPMPLSWPSGQSMSTGTVLPSALASIEVGIRKSNDAGLALTCQPSAMVRRTSTWLSAALLYCAVACTLASELVMPAARAVEANTAARG